MNGTLTFLGTGTSMGVPTVGCSCSVCTSANPRDRRLRPSVLIRWSQAQPAPGLPPRERNVVIDTGPDFREQALRTRLTQLDAVFYTHAHADHIFGLDDLRPLSFVAHRAGSSLPLYASPETQAVLERVYDYTFKANATYATRARVQIRPLADRLNLHGAEFLRVPVLHGKLEVAGFRFGDTAYLTDVSEIPESSFALLQDLETLVLPALRHEPHPSHATVAQAVEWARRIGARQTWLTHIAHELGHHETNSLLPHNVRMAWDGLEVPIRLNGAPEAA
ncbi:MAG TPA: MBL fold metallo-hydrolase [Terracidiphilus sp.]